MQTKTRMLTVGVVLALFFVAACSEAPVTVTGQQASTPNAASPTATTFATQAMRRTGTATTQATATTAPTSTPPPPVNLTGVWQGNDGGYYYLRQLGNTLVWAGFSLDDGISFTNVYCATLSGTKILGQWADTPRGHSLGNGLLSLTIDSSDPNHVQLVRVGTASGFTASQWSKLNVPPSLRSVNPAIAPSASNAQDVTGAWTANDNGDYYIRQVSNQDGILWLGTSWDDGLTYTNVLCGNRYGDVISGTWFDIPRGGQQQTGPISLTYSNPSRQLSVGSETGGFGPVTLTLFAV